MRIAVVGGTGFMGPALVRSLVALGHTVTVLHSGRHEAELPAAVRHVHVARAAMAGEAPVVDVAIDMAPMTQRDAEATVDAFRARAGRLVIVSSADVYRAYGKLRRIEQGPPEDLPLGEDAALRTVLHADRAARPHDEHEGLDPGEYEKLLVERVVRSATELHVTVLRLGFVFGPRSYRLYGYVKRMLDRRPAIVLEDRWAAWRGTYAFSENVAHAIALATQDDRAAGRTYNVGEARPRTTREVVERFAAAMAWRGRVITAPAGDLPDALAVTTLDLAHELVLETSAIRREIGFDERVLEVDAFARTVAWLGAHPVGADHPSLAGVDYAVEDQVLRALAPHSAT